MFGRYRPPVLISLAALVAANLVPLLGVLLFGWKVGDIMLLFWLENVVIGVFTLLRMLVMLTRGHWSALALGPFFAVHYGLFCVAHGALVIGLFIAYPEHLAGGFGLETLSADLMRLLDERRAFLWPILGLVASHAVSFVANFIGSGEYTRTDPRTVMGAPYGRIMLLHVTILLGGIVAMKLGQPVYALAILVLLKIAFDIHAHLRERRLLALTPTLHLV